ncbi:hypothetical protein AYY16_00100 [Morganella psychrotolerans]|nr:hypothetical protein AYY16_00100 [Morganella psychrotolerans]
MNYFQLDKERNEIFRVGGAPTNVGAIILALYVLDLALHESGEEHQTSYAEKTKPMWFRLQSKFRLFYSIKGRPNI